MGLSNSKRRVFLLNGSLAGFGGIDGGGGTVVINVAVVVVGKDGNVDIVDVVTGVVKVVVVIVIAVPPTTIGVTIVAEEDEVGLIVVVAVGVVIVDIDVVDVEPVANESKLSNFVLFSIRLSSTGVSSIPSLFIVTSSSSSS